MGKDGRLYVQAYPNPATTSFVIRTEAGVSEKRMVTITDLSGRVVKTFVMPSSGVETVATNDLSNGTYFIRMTSATHAEVARIVVNK